MFKNMFKNPIKTLLSISILLSPLTVLAADCSQKVGCDRKACEIQNKMEIAKANGQQRKLDGLNDALMQVNTYCTNDGLRNELLDKITASQNEIVEYRSELDKAIIDQEQDKVLKYQRKKDEEQLEIDNYQKALSLLQ